MTFELIKKVQILQKRILKMSSYMIDKERKLKDTEKLYMNLRNVLSKQSNLQITTNLNKVKNLLHKRGEKIKVSIKQKDFSDLKIFTNQKLCRNKIYIYIYT